MFRRILLMLAGMVQPGLAGEPAGSSGPGPAAAVTARGSTCSVPAGGPASAGCGGGDWQRRLTPEQHRILREKGTERPFTGKYHDHHEKGVYVCVACGAELFGSEAKFDSGSGWPSFFTPLAPERLRTVADTSLFTVRTEVLCAGCDGHLGHVFEDGPPPTGLRFCINSVVLDFRPASPPPAPASGTTPPR